MNDDLLVTKSDFDFLINKNIFCRTVTYHMIGKVKSIIANKFMQLEEASWIPESARYMQFIKNGLLNEVEPVGEVFVNIESIVDLYFWIHKLPDQQK